MAYLAAALLASLLAFWASPRTALAADTDAPPTPQLLASQLRGAEQQMTAARADVARLQAAAPAADPMAQLGHDLELERAAYRYRVAIRDEQVIVYRLAGQGQVAELTLRLLPADQVGGVRHALDGLRGLWALAGIEDPSQVRVRRGQRYAAPAGIPDLTAFYKQAGQRYGLDWTYLASINYIESDFGRVNGPSSAGALGPMQFLPSTWSQYGEGDVMDPHDSIFAAARYLVRNGAPLYMRTAIFRYNNDLDYVDAVEGFAAAVRSDPLWLDRLFYWGTQG